MKLCLFIDFPLYLLLLIKVYTFSLTRLPYSDPLGTSTSQLETFLWQINNLHTNISFLHFKDLLQLTQYNNLCHE